MYGKRLLVGRLAASEEGVLFQYAESFLNSKLALSPLKLPLAPGVFKDDRKTFDGLYGLFNDSLPDGWGLLLLDRKLRAHGSRLQDISPLDRLALVGKGAMGALEYEPDDSGARPDEGFLDLDGLADESRQILDEGGSLEAVDRLLRLGGSSGGARPKILCAVRQSDLAVRSSDGAGDFEPWLIKFRSPNEPPEAGLIEFAYSIAAKEAGVDMPTTALFPSKSCAGFFGVKRFDRDKGLKIHVHSACGLLHASHRHPSLSYESLLKLTQVLTHDQRETLKMARLMAFNVKAGNMDDHSKNFSFLMTPDGEWKMAPAFDLTPSEGFGGEHSTTVNGKGKNISDSDLLAAAATVAIPEKAMLPMIAEVQKALNRIPEIIASVRPPIFMLP